MAFTHLQMCIRDRGIDYSALSAKLNQGDYDIITCPSNVSAILYNNKDMNEEVKVISIGNMGLLYILTTDSTIQSMEDLKGRTVYSIGEGGPPEYTCLLYTSRCV